MKPRSGWMIGWLALGWAAPSADDLPGPPQAAQERAVTVSLIAEPESVQPGTPFWLGVRLQMAPGWHTYWKNPGDSGLPTRVVWKLPPGTVAGPLRWPYPERLAAGPLMDYGYAGEVVLLAELTPGPLPAGQDVTLAAQVKWLECREKCVPGKEDVSLVLPVRPDPPAKSAEWAALFQQARRRLPTEAGGFGFDRLEANAIALRAPAGLAAKPSEAYFFSEEPERVEHAAPQRLGKKGKAWWLELEAATNAPKAFPALRGVLVLTERGKGGARAFQVEARRRPSGREEAAR